MYAYSRLIKSSSLISFTLHVAMSIFRLCVWKCAYCYSEFFTLGTIRSEFTSLIFPAENLHLNLSILNILFSFYILCAYTLTDSLSDLWPWPYKHHHLKVPFLMFTIKLVKIYFKSVAEIFVVGTFTDFTKRLKTS